MYPWPASAISREEMALLYQAREALRPRVPITELLRLAVVQVYARQLEHQEEACIHSEHAEPDAVAA